MQYLKDQETIYTNIRNRFELLNQDNNNPELVQKKKEALSAFEKLQFPGTKSESYKYTPIAKKLSKEFTFEEKNASTTLSAEEIKKHLITGLQGNIIVFVNGEYSKEHSKIISPADQLAIHTIEEQQASTSIGTEFPTENTLSDLSTDPFLALNTAMAEAGVYINVPEGKILEHPIVIYNISSSREGSTIQHTKNFLAFETGSQAKVVEYFCGEGNYASFSNTSTELILKESAIVSLYKIQDETNQSIHVDNTNIKQAKQSVFTSITVSLKGDMIRNNLSISLDDEYCEANMYGLSLLNGTQHVDHHTIVDHRKANCLSNELYKCILDDKAVGVFNGKIYVRPNAQKTNAFQSNKNILLSNDATINTKPQLEIWADDVKCSHGATTGQLDEEQLFYLRTRGLGKETARTMLLYAFALDVLEKINLPALKDFLDTKLSDRLHK